VRKGTARRRAAAKPSEGFLQYIGALHRAIHGVGLFFDKQFDGSQSQAEVVVLLYLWGNRASTINDVHRALLHRRSTLTSVLDRLETKGLLERRVSKGDRRNLVLKLTQRGHEAAARAASAVADLEQRMNASSTGFEAARRLLESTATATTELTAG
jgi:DNA-binding MarR family transcriptional regulator